MEILERLTGKVILVTGGTGFIGSHVVEELIRRKARVVIPYRALDPNSYFITNKFDQNVVLAHADIKDANRVFELITRYEVAYIVHLAAQPIVTTAYNNPSETLYSNILGTVNILEAARRYSGVKGVIVASSDKAYGKTSRTYVETDQLRGDHPYEVSKSAADLIATSYYKTYNIPVVITRFGNVYGPGDLNFNRIIPGIMQTLFTGQTLKLRSDGTFIRDYVYVSDVASAYIFLLQRISRITGNAYNISTSDSMSVLELIKKSRRSLNKKIPIVIEKTAINEIPYQHLDYTKIKKLGWNNKTSLNLGIKKTFLWYRKYRKKLFMD